MAKYLEATETAGLLSLFGLALLGLMNGKPVVKATQNWLCCLFNAPQ